MDPIPAWLGLVAVAVAGAFLGSAAAWLILHRKLKAATQNLNAAQIELVRLRERSEMKEDELGGARKDLADSLAKCDELQKRTQDLTAQVVRLETSLQKDREHGTEKMQFLDEAREKLSDAFKALADEILDQKAGKLDALNMDQIGNLLSPLQDKLKEFNETVQNIHHQQGQERASLKTELGQLKQLNQTLSQDAQNLAVALKGSSKTQGNWGEMVLERILETSGLEKGREYELRQTFHYEDGRRGQPDVIIKLPESRHIIIDAKVSLSDYDDYCNATSDSEAQSAACRHVDSVRRHMKELAERNYQELYGLNSLDFVVMFVPVEPAFATVIRMDHTLWENAFRKSVLIVSPSGLLFVLRTVGVLWRQESQARNVRDIVKKGADLYNKLVGFVEELDQVGFRLRQAQQSFDDARQKLCTGQGNVIRQAEMLKDLGVKPSKNLPADLTDAAAETPSPVPPLLALAQDDTAEIAAVAVVEQISDDEIPF